MSCLSRFMNIHKELISRALQVEGFENWKPAFGHPGQLNRPAQRPAELPGEGRVAGVLVLLYPRQQQPHIVFTRRCEELSKHPGQISFPGGRLEQNEDPAAAALREAREEVGVLPENLELLGGLQTVYIPPTDFTVYPTVAWHELEPRFDRQQSEVAEVIEVSLAHLLSSQALEWGDIETDDQVRHVPYYRWHHHQIWGATALILTELLERIQVAGNL